jgi:hypothetical protein
VTDQLVHLPLAEGSGYLYDFAPLSFRRCDRCGNEARHDLVTSVKPLRLGGVGASAGWLCDSCFAVFRKWLLAEHEGDE